MSESPEDLNREVYPNAPLQLVAWEVRTPSNPTFMTPTAVVQSMSGRLADLTPIVAQPETLLVVDQPQQGARPEVRQRLLDRKQQLSIVIGPTAIVIETSAYSRFEEFVKVIERVARAAESVGSTGFDRVGMRYIDEIRVAGISDLSAWDGYIDGRLLTYLALEGSSIASAQGLTEYTVGDDYHVTLRSGALVGRTVETSGPLRLRREETGPYFLLDIDSYWAKPSDAEIPEFSTEEILEVTSKLRKPVRSLFETSITDKLRDEVLRRPNE